MRKLWYSLLAIVLASPLAFSQTRDYPTRPVKVIVLFGPGGTSDLAARFVGEKMSEGFGQPVVVDNRPGSSGTVGMMAAKSAPPDGYTLLVATNTPLSVNPTTVKDLPYDPVKDFTPIYGMVRVQNVILVSADSKLNTLADLLAEAKRQPRPMTVGTFSIGHQLTTEWFASLAGVKFTNVPYKGAGEIMTNLMGREIDFASVDVPAAVSLIKAGRLKALAVSGEKRHANFPDIPTVSETFPTYASYSWISLYVRAETPEDVRGRLTAAMRRIIALPEAREFAAKVGGELMPLEPQTMEKMQRAELERFSGIAKAAGLAAK